MWIILVKKLLFNESLGKIRFSTISQVPIWFYFDMPLLMYISDKQQDIITHPFLVMILKNIYDDNIIKNISIPKEPIIEKRIYWLPINWYVMVFNFSYDMYVILNYYLIRMRYLIVQQQVPNSERGYTIPVYNIYKPIDNINVPILLSNYNT